MPSLRSRFRSLVPRSQIRQSLVFHHVPKCAGTSIYRAIGEHYPRRATARLDAVASRRAAELTGQDLDHYREGLLLYFMSRNEIRYVNGHFAFSNIAYDAFSDDWEFITILRDPVDRWFSHYFFNRYKTDDHFRIHEDLEAFVMSDLGRELGHYYVDKFSGSGVSGASSIDEGVEAALANLAKFSIVGHLEDLDGFVAEFERRYSARLNVGHAMRNPVDDVLRQARITDEVRQKVEEICRPDLEIYRNALVRS